MTGKKRAAILRVLYISDRLNQPDGSSVHGREFVRNVMNLSHEIRTFPSLEPIPERTSKKGGPPKKNLLYYLRKINRKTVLFYLHRSNGYLSEWLSAGEGLVQSFRDQWDLMTLVASFRPDIIIYRQRLFNLAPYWISAREGIPILGEVNALRSIEAPMSNPRAKVTFLTRWAERKAIASVDGLFAVSNAIKERIDRYELGTTVTVIPNGVDTEKFNPDRFDKQHSKEKLGLSGRTVLGYVGSYRIWHGLETSVSIIEKLSKIDPRFHLLLVGHGQSFGRIKDMVSERGLEGCVTQVDYVSHESIPEYMAAFDYAVMSYPEIEPFHFSPLKMFEYMAMGVPVVATNIGQIGEIIDHRRTGLLVSPPNADNFVTAILKGRDQLEEIARNARKLMVDEHSWLAHTQKIMAYCSEVIQLKR